MSETATAVTEAPTVERASPRGVPDWLVAIALAGGTALVYALTFHQDWIYDPLRYAELMQRGPVRVLLGPQHALGNLLPLFTFRAATRMGYDGGAVPVLAGWSVAAAAGAAAATFVASRRLGGSRTAAALAAAVLAVTAFLWRAGGSGGVYGMAALTLALGWVAVGSFVRRPNPSTSVVLGAAAGFAVGGHLANLAFVAAALIVLFGISPRDARWRSLLAFVVAGVVVAGVVFLITAGVATDWSLSRMKDWALHPGIGGPQDRSSQVGWGISGLYPAVASSQPHVSWLPFGFDRANGHLEILITLGLLAAACIRGLFLATRSRTGAILTGALVLNAGLALLLASWYQSLRSDYWGLGLVPLAIMAGAGTRGYGRRTFTLRWVGAAISLAVVAALMAWNASQEVAPSLSLSHDRREAVAAIERRIPNDSYVLMSLVLAGRLADDGYRAEGGFAALKRHIGFGATGSENVVAPIVAASQTRQVFVSQQAFGFSPGQARFLGATGKQVWKLLHAVFRFQPVLQVHVTGETLYRLRPLA